MSITPEKSRNGIFFEIEIFILKYALNNSESIRIKKSTKDFCICHFFDLWSPFFEKMAMSPEKIKLGKIFRNRNFHLKIRSGPFWIDSNNKIFDQNFLSLPFFRSMTPHFSRKNGYVVTRRLRITFYCILDNKCYINFQTKHVKKPKVF